MPALSIMLKPASSSCNLCCTYCFYHDVAENRTQYAYGFMREGTAEKLIVKALTFADGESVSFAFQGGEPLLAGLDFFRFFAKTVRSNNLRNSPVFFGLQTNGVLLDEDWAAFFKQENFLIGLSLDGDEAANCYRKTPQGRNSYADAIHAAVLLEKTRVEYNIVSVLTGTSAKQIERIYRFFRNRGFRYLQFIPCLRPFGETGESELYMTPEQYGDCLIRLFRLYAADYKRGAYTGIRQLDNYIHLYFGRQAEQCGMEGHCSRQYVVEGNGNVYPCDFYCTDAWLLGNIEQEDFSVFSQSERANAFLTDDAEFPGACLQCCYFPVCRAGGCKRSRADRDYCVAYKRFFNACLPMFKDFT